jgi:hypothetical protein
MRAARFVLTLFVAGNLALLPISAAISMSHASKAEMSMSAAPDGDPGCPPPERDGCPLACCHTGLPAFAAPDMAPPAAGFAAALPPGLVPGAEPRPDPPPPRS